MDMGTRNNSDSEVPQTWYGNATVSIGLGLLAVLLVSMGHPIMALWSGFVAGLAFTVAVSKFKRGDEQ